MNIPFKKAKNNITAITAVLTATVMILSAAVFAGTAEKAELKANGDKADVILTLPQASAEEVSSIQISLNVRTNTENAEITFVPNEKLGAKIQESRYHKDTGVLNIYTVGTNPLFDKANPTITLGYVKISTNEVNGAAANVAFVKGSLKYVRGSSLEVYDNGLSYSESVKITIGKGGEADPPVITDPPAVTKDETPVPPETQAPVETAEPPVVIPPSNDDQPQPTDSSELREALTTAEGFKAADYTEESFKILQAAIAQAKEILNSANLTAEQVEEARMLLENAIGMLTPKTDEPAADITTVQNAESPSQNGDNTSENGEGSSPNNDNNNAVTADNNGSSPSNTEDSGRSDNDNGGVNPLVIVLIVIGVIVVGLGVGIAVTLNKRKGGKGKHSK